MLLLCALTRAESADPLFATNEVLEVTLTGLFNEMSRDRNEEPEYRPGRFSYIAADGTLNEFKIKVRPRGKSRRDRSVCTFPPLQLNFKKGELTDTLFTNQNTLKLVTHCRNQERFQNYLLKEYLAYRILNELSDVSFKVRLLRINYEETAGRKKVLQRYGFLIEHKKRMATRLHVEVVEPDRIKYSAPEPVQASIAGLFQYMVSNTNYYPVPGFLRTAPLLESNPAALR